MDLIPLVTLIVPILALTVATYATFFRQRPEKKGLTLTTLYDSSAKQLLGPLLRRTTGVSDLLPRDLRVTEIELRNTGNREIRREDFEGPLTLTFPGEGEVLEFQVKKTSPPDLEPGVHKKDACGIQLDPCLLNEGDSITVEVASTFCAEAPLELHGRIAGIREVQKRDLTKASELPVVQVQVSWAWIVLATGATVASAAASLIALLLQ